MSLDSARHHIIDKRDHPVADEMLQKQVEVLEADYQNKIYRSAKEIVDTHFDSTRPTEASAIAFWEDTLKRFSLPEIVLFVRQMKVTVQKKVQLQKIQRHLQQPSLRLPVPKTYGGLQLVAVADSVFFKNTLYTENDYHAWVIAYGHVPCAPILKHSTSTNAHLGNTYNVTARYSGMSEEDVERIMGYAPEQIQKAVTALEENLAKQRIMIIAELLKNGIVQSHPHKSNFVVEFIRKKTLMGHAETLGVPLYKGALLNPVVVNSLPYNKESFAFLPSVYFGNTDDYIPVLRIIDFDESRINTDIDTMDEKERMGWYKTVIDYQYKDNEYIDEAGAEKILALLRGEDPWQTT